MSICKKLHAKGVACTHLWKRWSTIFKSMWLLHTQVLSWSRYFHCSVSTCVSISKNIFWIFFLNSDGIKRKLKKLLFHNRQSNDLGKLYLSRLDQVKLSTSNCHKPWFSPDGLPAAVEPARPTINGLLHGKILVPFSELVSADSNGKSWFC